MTDVRFGKMQLAYDSQRRVTLLADFDRAVANQILKLAEKAKLPAEVRVSKIEKLPTSMVEDQSDFGRSRDRERGGYGRGDRDFSRDRGGDRGGRSGDRDRNRGGDRGGDRSGGGGGGGGSRGEFSYDQGKKWGRR